MKWQIMVLLLWASAGVAQQNLPAPHLVDHREAASVFGFSYKTSYKDVNCAGFISRERLAVGRTIQGGSHSPEVDHFIANDTVFLAGSGYEVGGLYSVLRELRDPNRYEYIAGQNKRLAQLGHLYAELGHLRIDHLENGYAVAKIKVELPADRRRRRCGSVSGQRQLFRGAPDDALPGVWRRSAPASRHDCHGQ